MSDAVQIHVEGDIVRFLTRDAADHVLTMVTPAGIKLIFPPARSVRYAVDQVGSWSYSWDDGGDAVEFEVTRGERGLTDLPGMSVSRRPRF